MRYLIILLLGCCTFLQADWQVKDLLKAREISEVVLSPNGTKVLYTVRSAYMRGEASGYRSEIWLSDVDGCHAKRLVQGRHGKWSPDGKWIAFLADQRTLCTTAATGGECRALAHLQTPILDYLWRPNGQALALLAPAPPGQMTFSGRAEPATTDLWLVTLSGRMRLVLESGDCLGGPGGSPGGFDWSPDGSKIALARQPTPSFNDFPRSVIDLVDVASGKCVPLVRGMSAISNPRFSPDSQWIAFCACDPDFPWSLVSRAYLVSASGSDPIALAATPDEGIGCYDGPLGWSADGNSLYALENRGSVTQLYQIPSDGSPASPIPLNYTGSAGCLSIGAPLLPNDQGLIPCVYQDFTHPAEVALIDLTAGEVKQISHHNAQLCASEFGRTELIRWTSSDCLEIEGLLTHPLHETGQQRYPLVVMAHGGPAEVWQQHFLRSGHGSVHPVTVLSAAGYAVLQPNIRGSSGYGAAFRQANRFDWGGGDLDDLLTGVDRVIEMGIADPNRLGIMGWSYGGYLTAWAVTQTNRFSAAAMGAGIADLVSMRRTCDIPDYIADYFGSQTRGGYDLLIDRSPLYRADQVTTPVLILHGDSDGRVPTPQAWEFYRVLRGRGYPVELVLYPRTAHVPCEPKLCCDLAKRHLDWFDCFLGRPSGDFNS
jgi:dipeptidyl aminopeptidase/acylaminoacyl peptidase